MIISIIKLPGDLIVKGYYSICSLFFSQCDYYFK
ncbi:hypothetical protein [Photobacterium kishitanii]|nr:hypothetical protein [Photobacterium kishitanii]